MAKVIIKYLGIHVEDDQVDLFIEEMEEILKRFAGHAYHFRYHVERPQFDGDAGKVKTTIGNRS
ncbi:MAG: hypothetical protein WBN53_10080 [Thermodesulfobacteriota bacterium]|jgi:hypothetical protein